MLNNTVHHSFIPRTFTITWMRVLTANPYKKKCKISISVSATSSVCDFMTWDIFWFLQKFLDQDPTMCFCFSAYPYPTALTLPLPSILSKPVFVRRFLNNNKNNTRIYSFKTLLSTFRRIKFFLVLFLTVAYFVSPFSCIHLLQTEGHGGVGISFCRIYSWRQICLRLNWYITHQAGWI